MHKDNDGMEGVFVRLSILFVVPFMVLEIDCDFILFLVLRAGIFAYIALMLSSPNALVLGDGVCKVGRGTV